MAAPVPKEKPAGVKDGIWLRTQLAYQALMEIRRVEHQLLIGDVRYGAGHAFMLGRIVERLQIAPWVHYIEQGTETPKS